MVNGVCIRIIAWYCYNSTNLYRDVWYSKVLLDTIMLKANSAPNSVPISRDGPEVHNKNTKNLRV